MYLLAICVSSLENVFSISLNIFKSYCLVLIYWVVEIFNVFWILTLYWALFSYVFSHSLGRLFILLVISFAVQNLFGLTSLTYWFFFSFVAFAFGFKYKKLFTKTDVKSLPSMLLFRSFMVLRPYVKIFNLFKVILGKKTLILMRLFYDAFQPNLRHPNILKTSTNEDAYLCIFNNLNIHTVFPKIP